MTEMSCEILPFWGGGECPVQYYLTFNNSQVYVRYRWGWISVSIDDHEVYEQCIGDDLDGVWTDEETTVYLAEISAALRRNDISGLKVPNIKDAINHPCYAKGPLPQHEVGIICGQHHKHKVECTMYVPANEVTAWIAAHESEHREFKTCYPMMWEFYLRLQSNYRQEPQ